MIPVAFGWQNSASQGDSMSNETSPTLDKSKTPAVAIAGNTIGRNERSGGNGVGADCSGASYTLTKSDIHGVSHAAAVRRLTPEECEALQGFPRGYTNIRPFGKPTPDSPRYKAIGNSMAVNVMQWIGQRISQVDAL